MFSRSFSVGTTMEYLIMVPLLPFGCYAGLTTVTVDDSRSGVTASR